jgi:polysaccharide biosynthesis transport protein
MNEELETNRFDLQQALRILWRRRMLLFVPWISALAIGAAAAFLLRPVYISKATLIHERPQALTGRGGDDGIRANADQEAEVMREVVGSTPFLTSVVMESGLESDPEIRDWASALADPASSDEEAARVRGFLVNHLRTRVEVRPGRGGVFHISVEEATPKRAQWMAGAVAEQLVKTSKQAQIEAVRATQEFSSEQLRIHKERLEESERQLESSRRRTQPRRDPSGTITAGTVQRARLLLEQARDEVSDEEQRLETRRQALAALAQAPDPSVLTTPETRLLASQLAGLERQLATSLLSGGETGSDVGVRLSIARKTAELEAEFQRAAASSIPTVELRDPVARFRVAEAEAQAKQARRDYLSDELRHYQERAVASSPDQDLDLSRLTREVEANRALYNSFLQQIAAAQISEAFETVKVSGSFNLLEAANLPTAPGKPNRPLILILAFAIGGVIGVGSVLVAEQQDQSVKNAEEIERRLGLPVIGAVPRAAELVTSRRTTKPQPGGPPPVAVSEGLLQRLKTESVLGLEFKRIYLKLARGRGRTMPRTLLVTSATRAEGKTTTTACLAITLARELREKLLLVDFDLRRPALHRALGLPTSSWGLAQMLQQRTFDERFIRSTVLPTLDFLPAGRSEKSAADLIDDANVEWFLREAGSRYAYVLMDSAPNLAVPDPLILGRAVHGVLYVIKAGSTIRKAAEYGVRVQREACDNVVGVLMNDLGEILPHYYGYHEAYGQEDDEEASYS